MADKWKRWHKMYNRDFRKRLKRERKAERRAMSRRGAATRAVEMDPLERACRDFAAQRKAETREVEAMGPQAPPEGWGPEAFFTDPRDGQVYRTVEIGGLVWMAENLNYDVDGSWHYKNDEYYGKRYGRLYTLEDAMLACPDGWHLPSKGEWGSLIEAAGGEAVAGKRLKSRTGWADDDDDDNEEPRIGDGNGVDWYGFSALPGGCRGGYCGFYEVYRCGIWWGLMEGGEGYFVHMDYNGDNKYRVSEQIIQAHGRSRPMSEYGYSVRCVLGSAAYKKPVKKERRVVPVARRKAGGGRPEAFFTDPRDGQVYRTVEIGGAVWMAENLNYRVDNSPCYKKDEANSKRYGRLYSWDAAKAACPLGWHLPSREEWENLVEAAGGRAVAAKRLKSRTGWRRSRRKGAYRPSWLTPTRSRPSGNGTDEFGFSARPGGRGCCRNVYGSSEKAGIVGFWWSAEEYAEGWHNGNDAFCWYIGHVGKYRDEVGKEPESKSYGFSVRCVRDA